jgi:hypothetical protein
MCLPQQNLPYVAKTRWNQASEPERMSMLKAAGLDSYGTCSHTSWNILPPSVREGLISYFKTNVER